MRWGEPHLVLGVPLEQAFCFADRFREAAAAEQAEGFEQRVQLLAHARHECTAVDRCAGRFHRLGQLGNSRAQTGLALGFELLGRQLLRGRNVLAPVLLRRIWLRWR